MLSFKKTKVGFRKKIVMIHRVKSYSSNQQILLVGEGDLSFSLSLATSFQFDENMVPTTIDSYDDVIVKHKKAQGNLELLKQLGAQVFHGFDATAMAVNFSLCRRMYDRIIFNFPHAGYCGEYEAHPDMIMLQQRLVRGFLDNITKMLQPCTREVHVTHRTQYPFNIGNSPKSPTNVVWCYSSVEILTSVIIQDTQTKGEPGRNPTNLSHWSRLRLSKSCHLEKACKGYFQTFP
ncbi:hypothetical protein OSB04_006201 [Centaurea solstitialis]|uniref:25S rRNA (uridine-N(3))-methyltransferase BMT5-like domain-containing protein n=1 Tax=Centaurea solstitialis TaxID=347529 RepID=A0AA38TT10_9ASTR|nr:hypothetical protein OSB04_006201 [Centaurea solstitialis]